MLCSTICLNVPVLLICFESGHESEECTANRLSHLGRRQEPNQFGKPNGLEVALQPTLAHVPHLWRLQHADWAHNVDTELPVDPRAAKQPRPNPLVRSQMAGRMYLPVFSTADIEGTVAAMWSKVNVLHEVLPDMGSVFKGALGWGPVLAWA